MLAVLLSNPPELLLFKRLFIHSGSTFNFVLVKGKRTRTMHSLGDNFFFTVLNRNMGINFVFHIYDVVFKRLFKL